MSDATRSILHEVMEQQTVSIAKVCHTFYTHASVMYNYIYCCLCLLLPLYSVIFVQFLRLVLSVH